MANKKLKPDHKQPSIATFFAKRPLDQNLAPARSDPTGPRPSGSKKRSRAEDEDIQYLGKMQKGKSAKLDVRYIISVVPLRC